MDTLEPKKSNESRLKTKTVTLKQSLMGACTNIIYRLGAIGGIKMVPQLLKSSPTSNNCVIFGEVIEDKMIAKQRLGKIIWFTYREKLMIAEDINSDVGWGCMPRVGQMVLAQALCRHFSEKNQVMDQKQILKIIQPFLDDSQESAGYSLSTILKHARRRFGILPGQWFNIGKLCQVMRKIQEQNPLKGSQDLKVVFFSQSVIFVNVIEQASKINKCACGKKKLFCIVCNRKQNESSNKTEVLMNKRESSEQIIMNIEEYEDIESQLIAQIKPEVKQNMVKNGGGSSQWEIYDEHNQSQWNVVKGVGKDEKKQNVKTCQKIQKKISVKEGTTLLNKSLLLIVSIRISQKTIEKQDTEPILNLLSLPSSLGIIGGVPSKALYIVGYQGDQLIYLDPHYVQEHVDKDNFVQNLNTFFCTQYRTISMESLDPSMALCFYLRSFEDVENLLIRIEQIKAEYEKNGRSFFISVMEKDDFEDQLKEQKDNNEEDCGMSFEYSSLEFRDITDSY